MQDGVNRGWSQCYMTLESLMEPLEDVKSEPPRMFDLGAEDQPVSD